jgi:hypothetical protein
MNEAEIEAVIDRRVQARLSTDRDYLFAENSEQQSLAERKIELQEELAVLRSQSTETLNAAIRMREIEHRLEIVIADLQEMS